MVAKYDRTMQQTGDQPRVSQTRTTSTFWIDESGSKATANRCYVVAGIKTRRPDDLQREIEAVRDQHRYYSELKFGRLTQRTYPIFVDLVDVLEDSDAHLVATVVDESANPFRGGRPVWEAYGHVISRLVVGNVNQGELVTVLMDKVTTPRGTSLGSRVKRTVNTALNGTPCIDAMSLDSKSTDLLQAADLVAGAIRTERMRTAPSNIEKTKLCKRLALAFDVPNFDDRRTGRVNIQRLRSAGTK